MLETTASKLDEVFKAVLEIPTDTVVSDARQETQPSWDSLAHVVLVGALESEFGLQVDAAESLELTSYARIARFLEERGL